MVGPRADVLVPLGARLLVFLEDLAVAGYVLRELLHDERGRDSITERSLRAIVAEPVWERQVPRWAAIAPRSRS